MWPDKPNKYKGINIKETEETSVARLLYSYSKLLEYSTPG
jgi:hypothetical protein